MAAHDSGIAAMGAEIGPRNGKLRTPERRNKNGPLRGHVQEAKLVGNSGKAMQDAVPPARTAKEVTLCVESEGHTSFAASWLPVDSAFAAPKPGGGVIGITANPKCMIC